MLVVLLKHPQNYARKQVYVVLPGDIKATEHLDRDEVTQKMNTVRRNEGKDGVQQGVQEKMLGWSL